MKFIIDESTGPGVSRWLKQKGFDSISVYEFFRGIEDENVLKKAVLENRILITNDKDFGELIFKNQLEHRGIILLRLLDERSKNKISVLEKLIDSFSGQLKNNFTVVTETSVRIKKLKQKTNN